MVVISTCDCITGRWGVGSDRSNAIPMLHGTTGSGAQSLQATNADFLFDPSRTSGLGRDSSERPEEIANGHHTTKRKYSGLDP
jgi:hypothetical protein